MLEWYFEVLFVFVVFYLVNNAIMNLEKTKKILIRKAKTEYFRWFWRLDIDESELNNFIQEIKQAKSIKALDAITFNLFNY